MVYDTIYMQFKWVFERIRWRVILPACENNKSSNTVNDVMVQAVTLTSFSFADTRYLSCLKYCLLPYPDPALSAGQVLVTQAWVHGHLQSLDWSSELDWWTDIKSLFVLFNKSHLHVGLHDALYWPEINLLAHTKLLILANVIPVHGHTLYYVQLASNNTFVIVNVARLTCLSYTLHAWLLDYIDQIDH